MSTMSASWAVVGSGPRREYHTARLHRTQRLPQPDWQVCSVDPPLRIPLADVSTDGTIDAAQLRRRVSGGDNKVRVPDPLCLSVQK